MTAQHKNMTELIAAVASAAEVAAQAIPPAWPLASSVAVNPFLGQIEEGLAQTGAQLARVAGCRVTMPRSWYAVRIASGEISDADLSAALSNTRLICARRILRRSRPMHVSLSPNCAPCLVSLN